MNLAKSKYSPANLAPRSNVTKNEAVDGGVKTTVDIVDADGKAIHVEYTAKYDGKSRTLTTTGTNAQGVKINNTVVSDKQ